MRALLHPAHRPVMPGLEPALEVEPGRVRGIGARKAAGDEAEPRASALIASSRLSSLSTARLYTVRPEFVAGISVLRPGARQSSRPATLAVEAHRPRQGFRRDRARSTASTSPCPRASIYGLLGPNGAGKTTTLRMLLGIIDPDRAATRTRARPRAGRSMPRHEVGYLPEERGLYPAMHARDAIAFMGALRGLPLARRPPPRRRAARASMASATGRRSRSAPCPRAWRRPSSCSARSSTSRG